MALPKFLLVFIVVCCLNMINNGYVEGIHKVYPNLQSVHAVKVKNLHRTGFHFQPARHWMNDPNGPMYYKGIYHLFYQYNPKGSVWGNIVWAHSVSTDLINWEALNPAIYPSKPFDIQGCWSGSATILPGDKPVILYTGIDSQQSQLQNYAIPSNESDPYLREWIKPDRHNPIVVPTVGMNASAFRDPTTAWLGKDGHWRIAIGGRRNHRGIAYLYRSRDFMTWVKAKHPLHTAPNTGMWECPDFYPIPLNGKHGLDTSVINGGVKHVLKVSLDVTRYEYYTIGTYNRQKDKYIPDENSVDGWNGLRYDYGNFYASKSFFDAGEQRRILWGWANESDIPNEDVKKGWAGIQAIPRVVWLDSGRKQLVQWPVQELETLRQNKVEMNNQILKKGDHVEVKGITAAQADVDVIFSFANIHKADEFDNSYEYDAQLLCSLKGSVIQGGIGPFGLLTLASKNLEEYTPVFFRIFKNKNKHKVLMCSDAKSSSLKKKLYRPSYAGYVDVDVADGEISLRSLIDHSVVESFGAGGKTCITSRVYPTLAVDKAAHLYVFNNGTEPVTVKNLNAWSMKSPKMNIGEKQHFLGFTVLSF